MGMRMTTVCGLFFGFAFIRCSVNMKTEYD